MIDQPGLTAPDQLAHWLLAIWQEVLGHEVALDDNFFAVGGDSIKAARIMNKVQQRTQAILHPVSIFDAPSVAELTGYLTQNYPKLFASTAEQATTPPCAATATLSAAQIEQARQMLARKFAAPALLPPGQGEKNKRAIFLLSAPRSGSTLLRVILGGHTQLFSPPELYLLAFKSMNARAEAFAGRLSFMKDGLVRAIMAVEHCTAAAATQTMTTWEAQDLPTKAVYQWLQSRLGTRTLVDKTPPYALNPAVLARMEAEFDHAYYIHLVRHPVGMIRSFEEARIDLATGDVLGDLPLSVRQKAELWWLFCQQNIGTFLENIPAHRQHQVNFEALVKAPEVTIQELCQALGLAFDPAMLQPYAEQSERMTDGVHELARLVGDPKFHTHQAITASVADRWQGEYGADFLSAETWQVAEKVGYARTERSGEACANADDAAVDREVWEI